jgi:hypothetical protein
MRAMTLRVAQPHLFGVESAHANNLAEADRLATLSEELYRKARDES